VIAVDAPRSLGKKILAAIAEVSDEAITHVVYSHYHADHIGAAHLYPNNVKIIAQEATKGFLEEAADPKRPLPTIIFSDAYTISVAQQTLQLDYLGPNHELGNITIYSPQQKVLMMVDVVWPGWVPFQSIGVADHIPGVIKAMDQLLTYDFDIFVGGHADRLGTRQDIELQKAYINDLQQATIEAYEEVDFNKLIKDIGWQQRWRMFDNYFTQLSENCSKKIVMKWKSQLKGAEAFTASNCKSIAFSIWMD
jgi:glyoxylase-like metal-dependent hydrolase (beta-lactamase superfamily II)